MLNRTLMAAALSLVCTGAFAQATPVVTKRQENQQTRIDNGVQNGSLTKPEAARLERGQAHVANVKERAASDGHVGAVEKARLQNTQDRQSARIAQQKHDAQTSK